MSSDKVDVRFTTNYDVVNVNHVVGVIGSYKYLGNWDPNRAFLLEKWGTKGCWSTVVKLPLSQYFEWKLILINKLTREVQKWEECGNRWNWIDRGPIDIIVGWNMKELVRCSSCHCLVGNCLCTTIYTKLSPLKDLVEVTFRVIYTVHSNESVSLIGSSAFLGNWNPVFSRLFPGNHNPILTIQLPKNTFFEWKLVVLSSRYRNVIRWEERENRALEVQACPLEVGVAWNQDAKVGHKCSWMDACWVVSPCPCKKRYCKKAHSCGENLQNNRTRRIREKVAKEANNEKAFDESDYLNLLRDNHAHFSNDPISEEYEMNRNAITSADNIDGLLDQCLGIDGLGLDDIHSCSCSVEFNGQQLQRNTVFNTKAKTCVSSKISKPEKEMDDQNYVSHGKLFSNKQSIDEGILEEEKCQSNDNHLFPIEGFKMDKPTNHDSLVEQVELKTNEEISSLSVCENLSPAKHDSHNKVLPVEKLLSSKLTDDSDLSPLEKQLPNNLTSNDEMTFKTESSLEKPMQNNDFSPIETLSPNKSNIDDDIFSMEKPSPLTNICTTSLVENQSSSTIKSIIAHRDYTYRLKDKHVHFSDDPVSAVFEAKEASITPIDKTDSMLDVCCFSIDDLWLDETENCQVETIGLQQLKTDDLSCMEKPSPNKPTNSGEVLMMENNWHIKPTNSGDMLQMEKSPENKPTCSGDVFFLEKPFSSKPTNDHDMSPNEPTIEGGLLTIENTRQKQLEFTDMVPILKLSLNEHRDSECLFISQRFHPNGEADCALPSLEKQKSTKPINDDEMAESEEVGSFTKCRTIHKNNGTISNELRSVECTKKYDFEHLPTNAHFSVSFYSPKANPDKINANLIAVKTLEQDMTIVRRFSPQRTQRKKIELRLPKRRESKLSFDRFFSNIQEVKPVIEVKPFSSKTQGETQLVKYRADFYLTVQSEKRTKGSFLLHRATTQPALTNNGGGDLSLPWTRQSTDKHSEQDVKLPEIPTVVDSTLLPQSKIPEEIISPNIQLLDSEKSGSLSTSEIMALQNLANSRNLTISKTLQPDLPDIVVMFVFVEKIIPEYLSRKGFLKTPAKFQHRIGSNDTAIFTKQQVDKEENGSNFTSRQKLSKYNSISLSETNLKHKQRRSNLRQSEKDLLQRSNMSPFKIMPRKKRFAIDATGFPEKRPVKNIHLVFPNEMQMKKRVFYNSLSSERILSKKLINCDKFSLPEKKLTEKINNTSRLNLPSLNKQKDVNEGSIPRSLSEQQTDARNSSRSLVAMTSLFAMMIVGSCIFDHYSR